MESDGARIGISLVAAMAVSAGAVLLLSRLAPSIGLLDHPGGRKSHAGPVPVVGGLAIFIAVLAAIAVLGLTKSAVHFLLALAIVGAVGCWDDVTELSPRLKLAIQIAAASVMIWGARIWLLSVGDLLGWKEIWLSIYAVPLTVFAVVGVANSVNMIDGQDGLGGSIALIAFAWYAAVAADSGLDLQLKEALVMCAAIAGFLVFNLRFPWQSRARAFLGDAGSLMLGFALGWFAIDLTQGVQRSFPPIAALWVVLLPLADCVSLLLRRLRARRSALVADGQHIHHYLRARGFSHGQTLAILLGLSTAFGAVGYFGWRFDVPEPVLFWPFFFGFWSYHFWIGRAWAKLERRQSSRSEAIA